MGDPARAGTSEHLETLGALDQLRYEVRGLRELVEGIKVDIDRYRALLPDPDSVEGRLARRKIARLAARGG